MGGTERLRSWGDGRKPRFCSFTSIDSSTNREFLRARWAAGASCLRTHVQVRALLKSAPMHAFARPRGSVENGAAGRVSNRPLPCSLARLWVWAVLQLHRLPDP